MKKIFLMGAAAAFLAGCNSDSKSGVETKKEIVSDTAAQYQNSVNTDTAKIAPVPLAAPPLPAKTEARKEVYKSKATKTSTTKARTTTPESTTKAPATTTTTSRETSPAPTTTTDNTQTSTTTPTATPEKKGMSNSAKGAIIGGGAGAVGGAIISKKKG